MYAGNSCACGVRLVFCTDIDTAWPLSLPVQTERDRGTARTPSNRKSVRTAHICCLVLDFAQPEQSPNHRARRNWHLRCPGVLKENLLMDIVWQAEDSLREKKVEGDLKDLLKTLVAFANSVAPDDTAQIFIGERDDGTVQGVTNPDNIQKKVREEADKIFPEIYYRTEVYERDGKQCVRVDIKQNGLAPHFGGQAWVRRGSETIRATEDLYQQMIDLRQSKVRVLVPWIGKGITVKWRKPRREMRLVTLYTFQKELAVLKVVNAHWLTFGVQFDSGQVDVSEPMENVQLSWDDSEGYLQVVVIS